MKITCEFHGRLGNNMFQTAAMIGYTEKHGGEYGIPPVYKHPNIYKFFPKIPKMGYRPAWPVYRESERPFSFQEIPHYPNGVILSGFWQSELYFAHARQRVIDTFNLNYSELPYISIHVRRGDYLEYPANFPTVTEYYLRPAMEFFPDKTFLVFSDDIQWCKETFPGVYHDKKIIFCDHGNEFDQLSMMASCQGNIIANSSFSWWGAWLNKKPEKVVISPSCETWFGQNNPKDDTSDLIPADWIQLHSRPDNHNQWTKRGKLVSA